MVLDVPPMEEVVSPSLTLALAIEMVTAPPLPVMEREAERVLALPEISRSWRLEPMLSLVAPPRAAMEPRVPPVTVMVPEAAEMGAEPERETVQEKAPLV
jgi:hypothetical protein